MVSYIEEGYLYDGHVVHIRPYDTGYMFQIDSYGSCEGLWQIDSSQILHTVFERREDAQKALDLYHPYQ